MCVSRGIGVLVQFYKAPYYACWVLIIFQNKQSILAKITILHHMHCITSLIEKSYLHKKCNAVMLKFAFFNNLGKVSLLSKNTPQV